VLEVVGELEVMVARNDGQIENRRKVKPGKMAKSTVTGRTRKTTGTVVVN
jgi:hypothetical protein